MRSGESESITRTKAGVSICLQETKFKDALDDVKREIAIMKILDHPNIIRLNEVISNPNVDKMCLVLEYAARGQIIEWDDEK